MKQGIVSQNLETFRFLQHMISQREKSSNESLGKANLKIGISTNLDVKSSM
jgi:hypothetical protein